MLLINKYIKAVKSIFASQLLIFTKQNTLGKTEKSPKVRAQCNWTNGFVARYNCYSRKILGRLKGIRSDLAAA
jgi:hypothetical protein